MPRAIDLNADLGESFGPWRMGDDPAMLDLVTSASIACGGHAGDAETMFATLTLARDRGVTVGAHPGYADREGFGRRVIPMTGPEIERLVAAQTGALLGAAALAGARVRFVKAHGALGNLAAAEPVVAEAVARATAAVDPGLALLAIAGTALEAAGRRAGLDVYAEIFADRAYLADGRLAPRARDGAVLHDPEAAADRLLGFLATGRMPVLDGGTVALEAQSICVHGDGPAAVAMARRVRAALEAEGVTLAPFLGPAPSLDPAP